MVATGWKVFLCVALAAAGCTSAPVREALTDAGTGADVDAFEDGDAPTMTPVATCLPGATSADCDLCKYGVEQCTKACPKIDCSAFPPPAACKDFCAGEPCCECRLFSGNEYWWRQPERRTCTNECGDMERRYKDLVSAPAAKACEVNEDCRLLFPFQSCNGSPALGYINNYPVNAKYYEASGAKAIEQHYRSRCKLGTVFDGGPVKLSCVNKMCVATAERGCLYQPDAGF